MDGIHGIVVPTQDQIIVKYNNVLVLCKVKPIGKLSPTFEDIDLDEIDQDLPCFKISPPLDKRFLCQVCGNSVNSVCNHDKKIDDVKSERLQKGEEIKLEEKPFCCQICGRRYLREPCLRRHVNKWHNPKFGPYNCKKCQIITSTKEDFWQHKRLHIKPDKIRTCPQCPFVTEYRQHLQYHLKTHLDLKPFKCSVCSYACIDKYMLASHMKSHQPDYQFQCLADHCNYATNFLHKFNAHMKKHEKKGITWRRGGFPYNAQTKSTQSTNDFTQPIQSQPEVILQQPKVTQVPKSIQSDPQSTQSDSKSIQSDSKSTQSDPKSS